MGVYHKLSEAHQPTRSLRLTAAQEFRLTLQELEVPVLDAESPPATL